MAKGERSPRTSILKAGVGWGGRRRDTAHATLRTGPRGPYSPIPKLEGPRLSPGPGGRALPRQPTRSGVRASVRPSSPRGPRAPYLVRHPGRSPRSSFRPRSPAPAPPARRLRRDSLRHGRPRSRGRRGRRRDRAGRTRRRGGRGRARPAPRLASQEGWSRFRPETPASAACGAQARTTLPRGRRGPGGLVEPLTPHPGPREAARRGWALGPAWWPVYGGPARVYASSVRPSIHSCIQHLLSASSVPGEDARMKRDPPLPEGPSLKPTLAEAPRGGVVRGRSGRGSGSFRGGEGPWAGGAGCGCRRAVVAARPWRILTRRPAPSLTTALTARHYILGDCFLDRTE